MSYSVAVINLTNIKSNLSALKSNLNGEKVCAVVKSDAYGHGLERVSVAIERMVDYFAVSFLEEGIRLRYAGITKPILILIPLNNGELPVAERYGLTVTVSTLKQVGYIVKSRLNLSVHVAVNTGMNRIGIDSVSQLKAIFKRQMSGNMSITGIFSHFFSCDKGNCARQFARFIPFISVAKSQDKNIICHICSSAPSLCFPDFRCDMIRAGILLYGYLPSECESKIKLKPCMKIYAENVQSRRVKIGQHLLYGDYVLQKNQNISIVKYGYADGGIRRELFSYNNRCMDVCAVTKKGNRCLVMGNALEIAKRAGTIPYEILVTFSSRSIREYIGL